MSVPSFNTASEFAQVPSFIESQGLAHKEALFTVEPVFTTGTGAKHCEYFPFAITSISAFIDPLVIGHKVVTGSVYQLIDACGGLATVQPTSFHIWLTQSKDIFISVSLYCAHLSDGAP